MDITIMPLVTMPIFNFPGKISSSAAGRAILATKQSPAERALAYFSPVSTQTQHTLTYLLSDSNWLDSLFATNSARLRRAYAFTTLALDRVGLSYCQAEAGLFIFIDLRHKLKEPTAEAEAEVWQTILEDSRLNISPGTVFGCSTPGFFRLCFAHPEIILRHALSRLPAALQEIHSPIASAPRSSLPQSEGIRKSLKAALPMATPETESRAAYLRA